MGRSKSSGRRGYFKTANVVTLPTRVPKLRYHGFKEAANMRRWESQFQGWGEEFPDQYKIHFETVPRARNPVRSKANRHLRLVEDRRQWHPDGPRRAATGFNRWAPRIIAPGWAAVAGAAVTAKLAFAGSSAVPICIRRKTRREVIFAKRKAGRRGQRRPRRSWFSKIHCYRR